MASIDELTARIVALSIQKSMGQDVSAEVESIKRMCQSDADKQIIENQCRALGLL